jgi:hypothetical protein
MQGGMEAIYDDVGVPTGFARFAPVQAARGAMFSARRRAHRDVAEEPPPVVDEADLYRD